MPKPISALLACLFISVWAIPAFAADTPLPAVESTATMAQVAAPDSAKMEKELQSLNWEQFKSVVESVPKMKADVDAYGPLGWQYVKSNYTTYGWKKSIDRLDADQKQQLENLIRDAKVAK